MIYTEELKYIRVTPCSLCQGECRGHRLKISWEETDPKPPNVIWIDGQAAYEIDDNEISTIAHLKNTFPQG